MNSHVTHASQSRGRTSVAVSHVAALSTVGKRGASFVPSAAVHCKSSVCFCFKAFSHQFHPQAVLNGVGVNRGMLPRAFG